jgi:hypothetical protein
MLGPDEALQIWWKLHKRVCSRPWANAHFELKHDHVADLWEWELLPKIYPPGGRITLMRRCSACHKQCPPNPQRNKLCADCEVIDRADSFPSKLQRFRDARGVWNKSGLFGYLEDYIDINSQGWPSAIIYHNEQGGLSTTVFGDRVFRDKFITDSSGEDVIQTRKDDIWHRTGCGIVEKRYSRNNKAVALGCQIRILEGGYGHNPDELGDDPFHFPEIEQELDDEDSEKLKEEIQYFINTGRIMTNATWNQLESRWPDNTKGRRDKARFRPELNNNYRKKWVWVERFKFKGWALKKGLEKDRIIFDDLHMPPFISSGQWEKGKDGKWSMENWFGQPAEVEKGCDELIGIFNKKREHLGQDLLDLADPVSNMTPREYKQFVKARGW